MASIVCDVTNIWKRCVTPASYGREDTAVQMRLETKERDGGFDVYAWGAQIEKGSDVGPIFLKHAIPDKYYLYKRFSTISLLNERWDAMHSAWLSFTRNILVGIGARKLFESINTLEKVNHAHNLFIQILASEGILGFLGWLLPISGGFLLAWQKNGYKVSIVILVMILLNMLDLTYYSFGVFYPYWSIIALLSLKRIEREMRRQGSMLTMLNAKLIRGSLLDSEYLLIGGRKDGYWEVLDAK